MQTELTFGEHVRRLRRDKQWSLHSLSESTGLSYSHLSRVENDSVPPGVETVTKLADVLNADLAELLRLAGCLPRQILDRLMLREDRRATTDSLKRTAGPGGGSSSEQLALPGLLADLAESGRISADAARQIALAVHALVELPSEQRSALVALVLSMAGNNET